MSQTNFNDMPNECIQLILKDFSLNSLMPLRGVCHRWLDQVTGLCETRTSLKLFGSRDNYSAYQLDIHKYNLMDEREFRNVDAVYDSNILYVSYVGAEIWDFLVELFPRITEVLFYLETVNNLEHFLRHFSSRLANLTIFGPLPITPRPLRDVWALLNSCTALRRLHLFDLFDISLPEPSPVLGQLEHLSLIRYEQGLVETLSQLGPNCSRLTFGLCSVSLSRLRWAHRVNPRLFGSLTQLRLSHIFMHLSNIHLPEENCKDVFKFVCENCDKLELLDITTFQIRLDQIVSNQAALQNLTNLQVRIEQIFHQTNDRYQQLRFPNLRTLILTDDNFNVPVSYSWSSGVEFYYRNWLPKIFTGLDELCFVFYSRELMNFVQQRIVPRIEFGGGRKVNICYRLYDDK